MWRRKKKGEGIAPLPLSIYIAHGGLRQGPGHDSQSSLTCGRGPRGLDDELDDLGACDHSRIRRRTSIRTAARGRAVHAPRRGTRAGEERLRRGVAQPDRHEGRRHARAARLRGARVGQGDAAARRRGQRAVLRPVGLPVRRMQLHRPDRHLRQGQRLRDVADRLARARGPGLLHRDRRESGGHAPPPSVPHPQPHRGRLHRRAPRKARRH